jgi:hypothetical protein
MVKRQGLKESSAIGGRLLAVAATGVAVGAMLVWGFFSGRNEAAVEAAREQQVKVPLRISTKNGEALITLDADEPVTCGEGSDFRSFSKGRPVCSRWPGIQPALPAAVRVDLAWAGASAQKRARSAPQKRTTPQHTDATPLQPPRVRYAQIATKFRSAAKCRDGP